MAERSSQDLRKQVGIDAILADEDVRDPLGMKKMKGELTKPLGDLREFARVDHPFEATGTLVRVTGLVLEAAGIRVAASPSELGTTLMSVLKG